MITIALLLIATAFGLYFWAIFNRPNYDGIARTTARNDRAGLVPKSDMKALRESLESQKKLIDHTALQNELKKAE